MWAPLLFLPLPPSMNCWWVRIRLKNQSAECFLGWFGYRELSMSDVLRIFAFDVMGIWGWLTLLPCASTTGAVTFFQSHVTFFNLYYCTPDYVRRTIFLRTNKFYHILYIVVFLEAGFKSDNRPEPVDTLGISTSSYYFPRPLMGP